MKNKIERYRDHAFTFFRVAFGVLFLIHGLQKFGVFGGQALSPAAGLFFWAGVFEVIIGPLIIIGLATRFAALVGAVEMAVALVVAHFPKGFMPLGNGESAWMNLAAFLFIAAYGAGKWALDQKFLKSWA